MSTAFFQAVRWKWLKMTQRVRKSFSCCHWLFHRVSNFTHNHRIVDLRVKLKSKRVRHTRYSPQSPWPQLELAPRVFRTEHDTSRFYGRIPSRYLTRTYPQMQTKKNDIWRRKSVTWKQKVNQLLRSPKTTTTTVTTTRQRIFLQRYIRKQTGNCQLHASNAKRDWKYRFLLIYVHNICATLGDDCFANLLSCVQN